MKILAVNDSGIQGGGTEYRTRLLLEELLRNGTAEEIHLIEGNEGISSHEEIVVHKSGKKTVFEDVKKVIERNGIDLVQVHNLMGLESNCIEAAKSLSKPVSWFAHDFWGICGQRSFVDPLKAMERQTCTETGLFKCFNCIGILSTLKEKTHKIFLNKVDLALSPSNYLAKTYERHGICNGKWNVVRPWIDLKELNNIKEKKEKGRICFSGSLLPYKGVYLAVKAMKKVSEKFPRSVLRISGSGVCKKEGLKEVKEIAGEEGVGNSLEFVAKDSWAEVQKEKAKSYAFLFPSTCVESFGNSWAEAMALGVPVIASRTGSVEEIMQGNGVLFENRNVEQLAECIERVLEDKSFAKKLSIKGREFAQGFGVERAGREVSELYNGLVE